MGESFHVCRFDGVKSQESRFRLFFGLFSCFSHVRGYFGLLVLVPRDFVLFFYLSSGVFSCTSATRMFACGSVFVLSPAFASNSCCWCMFQSCQLSYSCFFCAQELHFLFVLWAALVGACDSYGFVLPVVSFAVFFRPCRMW